MIRTALQYAKAGLSIIPGDKNNKQPLVKWARYQKEIASIEQVKRWWKTWPKACVLLVTGTLSGIVVVDVDTPKGGTCEGLSSTRRAKTPNGYHFYYAHPGTPVRNSTSKIAPGIDVRGDGGYVVCPPSIVKGKRYEWLEQGLLPPAPQELLETKSTQISTNKPGWVEDLMANGCAPGTRNNNMAKLAGFYLKKKLDPTLVIHILDKWMQELPDPEFHCPKTEIEACVKGLVSSEVRKQTKIEVAAPKQTPNTFTTRTYDDYMGEYCMIETSWLINKWLIKDTIAMLVAPPGSYKTWIEFDMALAVAGGFQFLDGPKCADPGPVLIVQQEDFPGQIVDRLATIQCVRENLQPVKVIRSKTDRMFDQLVFRCPGDLPIHLHDEAKLKLDEPEIQDKFEEAIDRIRPKLAIVDPLYSALNTEDYMAKGAQAFLWLKRLRKDYGCSFLMAHHTTKASTSLDRQRGWGSQFINAAVESNFQQLKLDDKRVIVTRETKGEEALPKVLIEYEIQTKDGWVYAPKTRELSNDEATALVAEKIAADKGQAAPQRSGPTPKGANAVKASLALGPRTLKQISVDTKMSMGEVSQALANMGKKSDANGNYR